MIGAIIGDIVGSRFEFEGYKCKDFEFFHPECSFTDDSILTIALGEAVMKADGKPGKRLETFAVDMMWDYTDRYPFPMGGYGSSFCDWLEREVPRPYNSYGNGAAMRCSAAGWAGEDEEMVKRLSAGITGVTHNHPEGLKGAECTSMCIFLARTGYPKEEIRDYVREHYYPLERTLDEIRPEYGFRESCQETVPEAIQAFLESHDFESSIRGVISLGGDADTMGAINGAIAEAYYGVPADMRKKALSYLPKDLRGTLLSFEKKYGGK